MIKLQPSKTGDVVKVTFALDDAGEPVMLAADVHGWEPVPMKKRSNGTRSASLTVPAGSEIRFRYCTENGHWFDDPEGRYEPNGFGQTHTVVAV